MVCKYCKSPIVKNEPGYGYYLEQNGNYDYIRRFFHSECIEMFEMVELA